MSAVASRNRLKIRAFINNAKAFIKVRKDFGTFNKYILSFVNNKPIKNSFKNDTGSAFCIKRANLQ